ncbi:hypothetical protein [Methylobacter sp.]|nr:hypothetical protein [Methylobacter sp.]
MALSLFFTIFILLKEENGMSSVWVIGNHVKVQGMANDFKILSYNFIFGGSVEMILESPEGSRIFLRRRKSQVSDIEDEYNFDAGSNDENYSY